MEFAPKHGTISVLLIDADCENAERVERMLSIAQGAMEVRGGLFSVIRVNGMATAIDLVETETFGVVLLDLCLPDGGGLETLEQIRRLAASLPVIVLTDVDDDGLALAAIKAGAQDWLPKLDLGRNLLTRTIRHAIERKRAEVKLLRHAREVEAARARIEQQAAEIHERAEQLDKMNRDLDDFAYIASHDLKEPLRGIAAYCQILTEDYHDRLDGEGKRRLGALETLCERLERLIDNLLTYCRVGRVQTPEAKVDLNEVVAEQFGTFRASGFERDVEMSVAKDLPTVKGDGTLIGMVLIARFWCRYLCPMGALLSLFNRVSFLRLKLDENRCNGCAACTADCPMGIEPHTQYDNHNCIKCGRCVDGCHMGALSMDFSLKGSE